MDTPLPYSQSTFASDAVLSWDLGPAGTLSRSAAIDEPGSPGLARLVGWLIVGPRPIATYRLTLRGEGLPGLYSCVAGTFESVEG